ncbi:MAG: histone deacetylase [Anaerolineales bacterium]
MSKTGIAIAEVPSEQHFLPGHPESPRRFAHFGRLFEGPLGPYLEKIPSASAPLESVLRVHSQDYLSSLESICRTGGGFLDYGDTYATAASFQSALNAAGGTLGVLNPILMTPSTAGFALVRPPGHHATQNQAMGFCLLNNIAIAAREAQARGIERVLIVDFDVHHGNGTQAIFEQDPSVFYISTHQAGIYPGSGSWNDNGSGAGAGYSMNIPLPARAGDDIFMQIFDELIEPVAARFEPELVLVSAGYDAHWEDPLAGLALSSNGYYEIASRLRDISGQYAHGKILFVLEGGYDPEALVTNIEATLFALVEIPAPEYRRPPASDSTIDIADLIAAIRSLHDLG